VVEERASASVSKPLTHRPACFDAADGYVETPVLWRPDLAAGSTITGPAIIEEFGSTVPLHPGFVARIDDRLNIIVTKS
jgi:N-methylhydantoinase A